jgi:hypothetical protein
MEFTPSYAAMTSWCAEPRLSVGPDRVPLSFDGGGGALLTAAATEGSRTYGSKLGRIEPGDDGGDRAGGPAPRMERR